MGARVVLDTNVLISALGWRGAPHDIVQLCIKRQHRLLLSPDLLAELERVLCYAKLGFTPTAVVEYIEILAEVAELISPDLRLDVVQEDPPDNRILECAVVGRADAIVTGDGDLLRLRSFAEGRPILTPRSFLEKFSGAD
jgi:putative PIN family toxin of toxin-antitoxin system